MDKANHGTASEWDPPTRPSEEFLVLHLAEAPESHWVTANKKNHHLPVPQTRKKCKACAVTENRPVVARGWGAGGVGGLTRPPRTLLGVTS